ncbi:MAG: hypothetical protein PWR03_187 [Tenuifilum sp.]|nr:hypothetical protein [Tenuifilum sp.]
MRVPPLFKYLVLLFLSITVFSVYGQSSTEPRYRIMFYNVENLFDPFDDSLKLDNEFTPTGVRHWTWDKMERKINNIYKVIMAVGGYEPPVMVGLCEIENGFVLHKLVNETPLSKFGYRIIHRESPDKRGIDVALIYRPDKVKVQERKFIRVKFPDDSSRSTREIVYARCLMGNDTLHVFVNHWPSKYGGELKSESGRIAAAITLRHKVDSIKIFYPTARILIIGDFNDEPESKAIVETLGACEHLTTECQSGLINLSAMLKSRGFGSYKYQGTWGMIDQIIVSNSLLEKGHHLNTNPSNASVFDNKLLLEPDKRYTGYRPFRTFIGFKYHGGFSDHLPVYIDLLGNGE